MLQTQLKKYLSFLEYRSKPAADYRDYYGDVVRALDQLNGQLNEKAYFDVMEQQLIEDLQSDLRDLEATPTDSIP